MASYRRVLVIVGITVSALVLAGAQCGPAEWESYLYIPNELAPELVVSLTQWEYVPHMGDSDDYTMRVRVKKADQAHGVIGLELELDVEDTRVAYQRPTPKARDFSFIWTYLGGAPCYPNHLVYTHHRVCNLGCFFLPTIKTHNGRGYTGRLPTVPASRTTMVTSQSGGERPTA